MKRTIACVIVLISLFTLSGCQNSKMHIQPAQLTKSEQGIAELLGLNNEQRIFDFVVDDSVKSMQINTYELVDGRWEIISGGGKTAFFKPKGRIALGFDRIGDGMRVAIEGSGATSHTRMEKNDYSGMDCITSVLSQRTDIAYEQEIPLVIQIITSKNKVSSYTVDAFAEPQKYIGHEHVYAVTVLFSRQALE